MSNLTYYSQPLKAKNNEREVRVTFVGDFIDGYLCIAASRCTNKDNFSKKKGKELAKIRFAKAKGQNDWETNFTFKTKANERSIKVWLETCNMLAPKLIEHKTLRDLPVKKSFMQRLRDLVGV